MVHKVLLIVATANIKYNQMQLLRADRWPTILLCKVQVFQHFDWGGGMSAGCTAGPIVRWRNNK